MSSTSCESQQQLLARATTYSLAVCEVRRLPKIQQRMLTDNRSGNYRFLAADGRPFSGGAAADEGDDLVHARFARRLHLAAGRSAASRPGTSAATPRHDIAA